MFQIEILIGKCVRHWMHPFQCSCSFFLFLSVETRGFVFDIYFVIVTIVLLMYRTFFQSDCFIVVPVLLLL